MDHRGHHFERRDAHDDMHWSDDQPRGYDPHPDELEGQRRSPVRRGLSNHQQRRREWWRRRRGGGVSHGRADHSGAGDYPFPRMTQDGEAVSALELVSMASGARDHHARELCNVILRTLTRRGWIFAADYVGWETPSTVVQRDDIGPFLTAAANAIGGSTFGARLRSYHKTPAYGALLERLCQARRDYAARPPLAEAPSPALGVELPLCVRHEGHPVEPRAWRTASPQQQQQQVQEQQQRQHQPQTGHHPADPTTTESPLLETDMQHESVVDKSLTAIQEKVSPKAESIRCEATGDSGTDDSTQWDKQKSDCERLDFKTAERNHNDALVERTAGIAHTSRPLCVWRHSGGMWALLFAARPGAHPRRPWRIVAGRRAALGPDERGTTSDDGGDGDADDGGDVWLDRAKVIERASHALCSPLNVVAVAASPALEPPLLGDPDAIGFDATWAHVTAVCGLDQVRRGACASTKLPRGLIAHLAVRIEEAATHDTPHAPRCRDLANALNACLGHSGGGGA
ncbi:hypothetical protein pkur_cds_17 [Pandoravirus kuranda]|uniref:Uncharacterized protein n=1 Tax=Pandoravirus kuranda TaxID=3019033 RepID=A0AA95EDN5_9VIRU|nr:hypothetical protein pkur_cds_17 [Pandoravirus kuranda]